MCNCSCWIYLLTAIPCEHVRHCLFARMWICLRSFNLLGEKCFIMLKMSLWCQLLIVLRLRLIARFLNRFDVSGKTNILALMAFPRGSLETRNYRNLAVDCLDVFGYQGRFFRIRCEFWSCLTWNYMHSIHSSRSGQVGGYKRSSGGNTSSSPSVVAVYIPGARL